MANKLQLAVMIALGIVALLYVISSVKKQRPSSEIEVRLSELISASIDLSKRAGARVVQVRNMDDSQLGKLSKGKTLEGKKEFVTVGDKVGV